ncbi:MAG: TetR/AcrR family transcriptional regulator [Bacteroidetes bacterium]|nr:TetR/AcrR family transcriptional regulator [Bacteroidota bacterium]
MEEKNIQLLQSIYKLFMRNGIKSMTMDDISRGLGMSKKTLYKHFKDKNCLVAECLENYLHEDEAQMEAIHQSKHNAIDELFEIIKYNSEKIQAFHPSIHYDLEKYYPEAWKLFNDYKFNYLASCVEENLKKGIAEGLYRQNLNTKIIAKMHIARIDMIFDAEIFPVSEFQFVDVLMELIRYHIRGIASEKGLNYLSEKFKNSNIF